MYLASRHQFSECFRKPKILEPENVHLVLMTIACSHNLIKFNNLIYFNKFNSAANFTPPSTFDYEENDRVIADSWTVEYSILLLHSSTGLFISFPSSSHASCPFILLECNVCFESHIVSCLLKVR
jgi:hypothetical protein